MNLIISSLILTNHKVICEPSVIKSESQVKRILPVTIRAKDLSPIVPKDMLYAMLYNLNCKQLFDKEIVVFYFFDFCDLTRHVSKLAAAANYVFPRNSRFFVPRVATFKTVYVFNIAKTIFREMLTVFLYIVHNCKSRLIIHMQILMMRNDYQANKKEPKLRSTKSSSYFFQ